MNVPQTRDFGIMRCKNATWRYHTVLLFKSSLLAMCFLLQHRRLLYELFSKNYRVRRNVVQNRLSQEFGEDFTKADTDRLLKVR